MLQREKQKLVLSISVHFSINLASSLPLCIATLYFNKMKADCFRLVGLHEKHSLSYPLLKYIQGVNSITVSGLNISTTQVQLVEYFIEKVAISTNSQHIYNEERVFQRQNLKVFIEK